ncbi:MAG: nuclease-related domain-containing protein [Patescibacteria group bacterium]
MFISKKQKRSPLQKNPLRRPGQSLEDMMKDIFDEIISYFFMVLFISVLAIIEWINFYFPFSNARWIYSFVALFWIIFSIFKILPKIKKGKQIRLGMEGEKIVAEFLDELKADGYKVYNDIIDNNFNIDHIIIGPAGVFTIETKTWSKGSGKDSISYDGLSIKINGRNYPKDPINQVKNQVYWLSGFLENKAKIKTKIRPVIIFPGWFVEPMKRGADVWVLNEKSLRTFLKNEERVLSDDQINLISSHLEEYNRAA